MRSENFVAFITTCGFFIGLIFSIVKFYSVEDIIFYTLAITLFFYLFIHVVLIFFLQIIDGSVTYFDKQEFEKLSEEQLSEIKKREDYITALLKSIHGEQNVKEGV